MHTVDNDETIIKPLKGTRIIELASIGPVPFAGSLMAQMGAEITIVSPPTDRNIGLPMAAEFDYLKHHKQETAINLREPAGIEALLDLVKNSDVLLEGFRPGTLEKMGLEPAVLHEANPGLIVGRCGGWGKRSPRARDAGHDINYLALSGALDAIGEARPIPPLNLVGDFGGAAMHLLTGILAGLLQRNNTHRGCVIDTSIYEGSISLLTMIYGMLDGGLWSSQRQNNILDGAAPYYKCYQTQDNKWLALGAIEPKFFKCFLDLAQIDGIDLSRQNDRRYWPELEAKIAGTLRTKTRNEWGAIFRNTDACCTPVLSLDEARNHDDTQVFFKDNKPYAPISFT